MRDYLVCYAILCILCPVVCAELPSKRDMLDLVEHVTAYPPASYDVEVVSEFMLTKETEEGLRASVERQFDHTDDAAPVGESPEERRQYIEKNVQRMLAEQERPRRVRLRYRYSAADGYRVDEVIECLDEGPLFTGPAEQAEYRRSYVNVGNSPEDSKYVKVLHYSNIASLYDEAHGRRAMRNVWSGGTLDPFQALGVRSLLRVGRPEQEQAVLSIIAGRYPLLKVDVERGITLPDGSEGRRFQLTFTGQQKGGQSVSGTTSFDVPVDSFNPVWKVMWMGSVPMEVLEAKDGVATVWIDKGMGAPKEGRKYTLISRKINEPVDKDVFAFRAPEGFTSVDHSVNPVKIEWPDGRVEFQENKRPPVTAAVPKRNSAFWIFLLANLFMVGGALLFVIILKRRATQKESG